MHKPLKTITIKLDEYIKDLKIRYEQNEAPVDKKDKPFFLMMKEETAPIYQLLEEWEKLALQVIKHKKINIHPQQIISTKENIELIILHSYYIDVKRKRYMNLYKSCQYVMNQLLRALKEGNLI